MGTCGENRETEGREWCGREVVTSMRRRRIGCAALFLFLGCDPVLDSATAGSGYMQETGEQVPADAIAEGPIPAPGFQIDFFWPVDLAVVGDSIYVVDNVVHYCVANMPGPVPSTSTYALNNVTLPYGLALADKGYKKALLDNPYFREGLNVCRGKVTYKAVADDLDYEYVDAATVLAG